MESTANQWEWAGHIHIYIMVVCPVKAFTPLYQADEMYYEDEGEAGQKQSGEMY